MPATSSHDRIQELEQELAKACEVNEALKAERVAAQSEIKALHPIQDENTKLHKTNAQLKAEIETLKEQRSQLSRGP